jgi:cytosine/creatinine deaminase
LNVALEMATTASAAVLGQRDYGLAVGNKANFVIVNAPNGAAAVATVPADRAIVRQGRFQDAHTRPQFKSARSGDGRGR